VQGPRLILASASPRRQSLLRDAGFVFDIHPADLDEASFAADGMAPSELAKRLALAKAEAVASKFPDAVVLGADTIVAFGEQILGKPRDAQHAYEMLSLLSGTTHLVITGVAVVHPSARFSATIRNLSAVRMKPLTLHDIENYIATGQWRDKAGGYGIQDTDPFIIRMAGSHTNIVGLPMTATRNLLATAGITTDKASSSHS
jgi:septum formation protein